MVYQEEAEQSACFQRTYEELKPQSTQQDSLKAEVVFSVPMRN